MNRLLAGMLLAVVPSTGCFDDEITPPGPDDDVRITYVGEAVTDSVEGAVDAVRFFVSEAGSEDRPLPNLTAFFIPEGESCGSVSPESVRTNEEGIAETQWRLGDLAGPCTLRTRVVNSAGLLLEFLDVTAEVLHGQAVLLGWINEGESVTANGTLSPTGSEAVAFDRLSNEVPWRFRVISGPVQTVGTEFDSQGARTLVASGVVGAGRIAVESRWGDAVVLDLCVTAGTPAADIRLDLTPPGGTPPACDA